MTTSNLRLEIDGRGHAVYSLHNTCTAQPVQPTSQTMVATCRRQAQPHRLDVVHPDVAHADPGMHRQRDDHDEGGKAHPLLREDRRPAHVAELGAEQQLHDQHQRVQRHQHGGDALAEPVAQPVVGADHQTLGAEGVVVHVASPQYSPNSLAPSTRVSKPLSAQRDQRRDAALLQGDAVGDVHPQVAHAGDQVMQIRPDQRQHDQLEQERGHETDAGDEGVAEALVRDLAGEAHVEQPHHQRQQHEHQARR